MEKGLERGLRRGTGRDEKASRKRPYLCIPDTAAEQRATSGGKTPDDRVFFGTAGLAPQPCTVADRLPHLNVRKMK
jgi:hypothetical protein